MQHQDPDIAFPERSALEEMQNDMVGRRLTAPNMFLLDMEGMEEGGSLAQILNHQEALGDADDESFEGSSIDERIGAAGGVGGPGGEGTIFVGTRGEGGPGGEGLDIGGNRRGGGVGGNAIEQRGDGGDGKDGGTSLRGGKGGRGGRGKRGSRGGRGACGGRGKNRVGENGAQGADGDEEVLGEASFTNVWPPFPRGSHLHPRLPWTKTEFVKSSLWSLVFGSVQAGSANLSESLLFGTRRARQIYWRLERLQTKIRKQEVDCLRIIEGQPFLEDVYIKGYAFN
ncbi:hypothetical protein K457DRAFT_24893 [Linnemannia elongata AG-77]|uniref:Uncharacterized protein n=1 Tax=Linnemannia elongata AG-77 TaxID=1314771 RepID=A0A197JGX8_9FUNG|nr:hypothetical protein K457DRAFT_24893 [Linnemannia elongata AG-77]